MLPVVSANVGPLLVDGAPPRVKQVVAKVLALAEGTLQNRTNGENLPTLVQEILIVVLRDELDIEQHDEVLAVATQILNAA